MTDLEHAVESNRRAWDASADSHLRGSGWQELSLAVQETGFSCLDETLAGVLRNLDLAGKSVGTVKVIMTGGDTPETEYSFVEVTSNETIDSTNMSNYIIEQAK